MTLLLWLVPVSAALTAGLCAGVIQRRLPPAVATRVLTAVAVASAIAVAWGFLLLSFGYLVQLPWIARYLGWCDRVLPSDDRPSAPVGITSMVLLVVGAVRMVVARRRDRDLVRDLSLGAPPVDVLPIDEPLAFAVPGAPGHVVVSQSLLDLLDEGERDVVFAHEHAHLDHHHHRYVRWTRWAARSIPILGPLAREVEHATERWADEVAAAAVGDRALVARVIGKVALARSAAPPALGFGGARVAARVEALLHEPTPRGTAVTTAVALGVGASGATLLGATWQLHHLVAFAAHVCRL